MGIFVIIFFIPALFSAPASVARIEAALKSGENK